ncbi:beta-1,4-glucuronyltransferase 1-like isoform X1 [Schistocerca cancellata]|uniref:beta-1,4-glucuronyltransferase 1-like isoform X1 n=1 Tax=Schistocerca cancellata TaxID=274614 RepID=UPI002117DA37|nr:beta-1,4-glucuronyltransferase 1-like isoform X1 [Schistocerca cancellata]
MRCRLAKYLRSKIAVSIIITAVFGLVIKEALFPVRAFLLNSHFTEQKKPLRKYGDSQNALPSPSPESHRKAVFIPASFLNSEVPKNESYCNFNYKFPDGWNMTELFLEATPQLGNNGPYRVVYNLIEGRFEDNTVGVTYCTHATPEFLYHIAEIVNRWDGPVSVAVFAPGTDLFVSLSVLYHMCRCFPEMSRVTVHLIVHYKYFPMESRYSVVGSKLLEDLDFSNCSAPLNLLNGRFETFRHQQKLTYPVNTARNVARIAAKTTHVLVSDVELLPSSNLVPAFLSMFKKFKQHFDNVSPHATKPELQLKRYVFVLPVFEVEATVLKVPSTKKELLQLYSENRAVYFHRWVCLHCQRFPGLQKWLQKKSDNEDTPLIQPFLIVHREYPYHRWEPIYIGTNSEPLYSEILTWEGQQDKMTQMAEMCLMQYNFVILDGAFLVHTPGVKHRKDISPNQTLWRKPYEWENMKRYRNIAQTLLQKYTSRRSCKI